MFMEQFAFNPHALVNFVGGGGKTALIHKLMQEYSGLGPLLCTTTTRIHPPDPKEGLTIISGDNLDLLRQMVDRAVRFCPDRPYKLVVTRSYLSSTLLRGVPPDFDNTLDRECFPILLNEADGAASFSLKMPKDSEPVLMENAEYLVPVLGLDCLDQPIDSEVIFRWEKFSEHFPGNGQGRVTPQLAADILMHAQGVCKSWKSGMKIVPFINKVDDPGQDAAARDLAHRILRNGNFPIERVLFGSVFHERVESIRPS
jgi:probable selenium-dependent hydroxylase accessory protein YqeC